MKEPCRAVRPRVSDGAEGGRSQGDADRSMGQGRTRTSEAGGRAEGSSHFGKAGDRTTWGLTMPHGVMEQDEGLQETGWGRAEGLAELSSGAGRGRLCRINDNYSMFIQRNNTNIMLGWTSSDEEDNDIDYSGWGTVGSSTSEFKSITKIHSPGQTHIEASALGLVGGVITCSILAVAEALRLQQARVNFPWSRELVGWALGLALVWIGSRHSPDTWWWPPWFLIQNSDLIVSSS